MKPTILTGDCIAAMKTLEPGTVQTCVTSPPYFGLRDYGHEGQIGLEESPDAYVTKMVEVFREVRRVLKDDGTLWLNLGDSYAAQRGGTHMPAETLAGGKSGKGANGERVNRDRFDGVNPTRNASAIGLKHKDLIGIPWRVAFALQADGWYLRQDIIWHKPNPMPESVKDRCTKAHEYLFLLSKSERYFFDSEAMQEPVAESQLGRVRADKIGGNKGDHVHHSPGSVYTKGRGGKNAFRGQGHFRESADGPANREGREMRDVGAGDTRNRRSVWLVPTRPYKGAHFATFPPDLIRPCILAGSRPGDIVLDPFGGSGTTGAVAMEHRRLPILIELNPAYHPLINERLNAVQPLL